MTKILHYIREDYPGSADSFCLSTYKKFYPDFEFMAWRPGSSPLRILYDHGGLFIGHYVMAMQRLPDSFFEKSFIPFDCEYESVFPNVENCCYAKEPNEKIFLDFMERGMPLVLYEQGFQNDYKVGLSYKTQNLPDIDVVEGKSFGGFERKTGKIYGQYFLKMNFNMEKVNGVNLHYMIVDKDKDPNKVFSIIEYYGKLKYRDGSKHFFLMVSDGSRNDIVEKMNTLFLYHCTTPNKLWDVLLLDGCKDVEAIISEYIGRKFENLLSCEKLQ